MIKADKMFKHNLNMFLKPWGLREGVKKNTIESVIMIIPRQTPPPLF